MPKKGEIIRAAGLFGTLTESAADTLITVTRSLGNDAKKFEGFRPRYIELSLDPNIVRQWVSVGTGIDFSIVGDATGIGFGWLTVFKTSGVYDVRRTWYPPSVADQPITYDENAIFSLMTYATGFANVGTYKFFYDIIQGDEVGYTNQLFQV